MSSITQEIFITHLDLVKIAIDFFTAEETNPGLFLEIKEICTPRSIQFNIPNGEKFIKLGYLSLFDFSQFVDVKKLNGGGFKPKIVELLVDALKDNHIIELWPESVSTGRNNERKFKATSLYSKIVYENDLILNIICGWNYIIEKQQNSVLKIVPISTKGDISIGSGFYCVITNTIVAKPIVITNKHVVDNAKSLKLYTKDDQQLEYKVIRTDPKRDLAFIELLDLMDAPSFILNQIKLTPEILSEIITIGYPSIPMTRNSYQVFHKGEINSFVEDYGGNKLFLFSAKTSSGNSGSPIIDNSGMVVGIVTEELFQEDLFYKKGKLPYYAGIPIEEIVKSIDECLFN